MKLTPLKDVLLQPRRRALLTPAGRAALGGAQEATLESPVLAMDPAWTSADATPDFLLSWVSFNILAGDIITTQVQASGGSWSSFEIDNSHTVTAGDAAAGYVALGLSALANGDHQARAKVTRGTAFSNWSNTQAFTVSASSVFLAMDMSDFRNTYILLN